MTKDQFCWSTGYTSYKVDGQWFFECDDNTCKWKKRPASWAEGDRAWDEHAGYRKPKKGRDDD